MSLSPGLGSEYAEGHFFVIVVPVVVYGFVNVVVEAVAALAAFVEALLEEGGVLLGCEFLGRLGRFFFYCYGFFFGGCCGWVYVVFGGGIVVDVGGLDGLGELEGDGGCHGGGRFD